MAALTRYRPRPMATFHPVSQRAKYNHIRLKGMLRSAFSSEPGSTNSLFGTVTPATDNPGSGRGLSLGMMGAPGSATNENFPNSAGGMGGFATPLSAGLEGPAGGGMNPGSRRQSSISMAGQNNAGPRQILPGQLPGPSPQQRKGSMASVVSIGAS